MNIKLKLAKMQNDFNVLKKTKFRYYRGELTKQELIDLNWEQWQGVKPIKSELEYFLEGDADLNSYKLKIDYLNSVIYLLESILIQIKSRDWQLKTILEHKKFLAGN